MKYLYYAFDSDTKSEFYMISPFVLHKKSNIGYKFQVHVDCGIDTYFIDLEFIRALKGGERINVVQRPKG